MSEHYVRRSRAPRWAFRFLALLLALFGPNGISWCEEVKFEGVPDYQQDDFSGSNDCTPVASADVLGYWDAHGCPELIDGSNDFGANPAGVTALVDALKRTMAWAPVGTQIDAIDSGIIATAQERGYEFFAANDYVVMWTDITAEVQEGRPSVLTMLNPRYGSLHSVCCFGYSTAGGTNVIIVHDNWYPADDVYLSFSECANRTLTIASPSPTLYVDDDAPNDPGPHDPLVSDPLEDGSAEHPFDTIQEAVNAISKSGTILVLRGTYAGHGNRDIEPNGKIIRFSGKDGPSLCIIDCQGSAEDPHRAFAFQASNQADCLVEGFTIRNGYATEGGAIHCNSAFPIIRNCIITSNAAQYGGGVFCRNAYPVVDKCTIADNSATLGGGLYSTGGGFPSISNSIFWENTGGQVVPGDLSLVFCCIQGGYDGMGNISSDPLFGDAENGDYHISSRYGRWNPAATSHSMRWIYDDTGSPCLDAGDPFNQFGSEPLPNGDRLNLGAYGNTQEASLSGLWWRIPGDVNDDCHVNILDMIHIRNALGLDPSSGTNWKEDVNRDGKINVLDLIFVRNWSGAKCY